MGKNKGLHKVLMVKSKKDLEEACLIKQRVTERISESQNHLCHYCNNFVGKRKRTLDHIVPQSKGGSWKRNNLVMACSRCNVIKADLSYEHFMDLFNKFGYEKVKKACRTYISARDRLEISCNGVQQAV